MLIREYAEQDEAAVVALWHTCGLVVPWNDPHKDIARKLAVGRDLFLVGIIEEQIVATAMGGYEGHRGCVNYLGVHPDYRCKGLARKLMDALEERLLALGCPKINLCVRETNTAALGFYEALGYAQDRSVLLGKRLIPDG